MRTFNLFDDEVLPLADILELIDYDDSDNDDAPFLRDANLQYRQFLARLAELNAGGEEMPV
jgi:hypothetical protein